MASQEVEEEASQVVGHQVAGKKNSHLTMGRLTGKLCEECRVLFVSANQLNKHKKGVHESYVYQLDKAQGMIINQGKRIQQMNRELEKALERFENLQKENMIIRKENQMLVQGNVKLIRESWHK